ncbi:hypothetical protein E1301_Tti023433 [Triplophysa tibetana]|uniref:Uncharacterized protein n=1 Tax=Triplophysa tibetana TaxID=1572043 RepID=A0A5A9NH19_9TELE|nr:hypothetical protein E1301_Tti023433 [Triplophysa tibetana]
MVVAARSTGVDVLGCTEDNAFQGHRFMALSNCPDREWLATSGPGFGGLKYPKNQQPSDWKAPVVVYQISIPQHFVFKAVKRNILFAAFPNAAQPSLTPGRHCHHLTSNDHKGTSTS